MDPLEPTQRLKGIMISAAGLLIAVFLGLQIGNYHYITLLFGAAAIACICIALFSGDFFWVLTIASSFLSGTFPILGGSFTPFQILMAIGVGRFLVNDIVFKRKLLKLSNRLDLVMMAAFMGVLTFHAIKDRFGMRFLGSSVWGGRNYVNVYVGLAAFFIVQISPMKLKIWRKLPVIVLAVTGFDLSIAIITTIFPASIYKIYPFYSAVSTAGLQELLPGDIENITTRVGAFGNFGLALILLVLAKDSLPKLFSLSRLPRLLGAVIGCLAVLFSAFRTSVVNTVFAGILSGIRDLKWRVVLVLPLLLGLLFALSLINSELLRLPRQIQRSLQFIPGNWDVEIQRDAEASNEYRGRIWKVFIREYFPVHPWFGRGFGFRSQMAQPSIYKYNPNWDRDTVEVGNIHNGFLAALDALGIVGTIFFILWNLRLLARTFRVPAWERGPLDMSLRFLALYLGVLILSYWMGAFTVGTFLPQEFALAGVFLRLQCAPSSEPDSISADKAKVERVSTETLRLTRSNTFHSR